MYFKQLVASVLLLCSSKTFGEQLPPDHILWGERGAAGATLIRRQATTSTSTRVPDAACTNSPRSRNCWDNGHSVATDFDRKWPDTGKIVRYSLTVTNSTCNPDGNGNRPCLLINGRYPGPVITADWGDTLQVTVKNSMQDNGTSIHWHGLRQLNTVTHDGVNGITECPIAPGDTRVYTFKCTQFGTTWYHSHFSAQYGDGVVGTIMINGPASANYDIDLGTYPVTDWYYKTAFQLEEEADAALQSGRGPPPGDNILVNGTNKNPNGGGSYGTVKITKGKKYRLRLINTSVDANIRVSLDNHPFQIITADLVPIKPITANWVLLAIGQRYDVIFTANQTEGSYWFRAEIARDCASANNYFGRSIFTYDTVAVTTPTSTAATAPNTCVDMGPLVPWVANTVPSDLFTSQVKNLNVDIGVEQITTNGKNIVVWGVNLTAIDIAWDKPTIQYVIDRNTSYPRTYNLIEIPNEGTWTYWIIQETPGTPVPIPHPIHLHGHDYYVLGAGTGLFDKTTSTATLQFNNPIRRDTAFLPANGWLAIAFPTDNPGAWLMHCHIAWHVSQGLGVQFLESKSTIPLPGSDWHNTCNKWRTYWDGTPAWPKQDSGL